jgi:hypothetical protein
MHGLVDVLLVGGALTVSVVYAAFSLGPRALRRRVMLGVASLLRKLPGAMHWQRGVLRMETAAQKAGDSCGGCGSCASTPPAASSAAPEVRIPVSSIRKR